MALRALLAKLGPPQRYGDFTREFAVLVNVAATDASKQVLAGGAAGVVGWSVTETTGSGGAKVRVWDNPSAASGPNYGLITLGAGESTRDYWSVALPCKSGGLWLQVVSGTVEVALAYV